MGNEQNQGNHISKTLDYLLKYDSINTIDVFQIALNIGKPFISIEKQVIFDPDSEDKVVVTFPSNSIKDEIIINAISKFTINDKDFVINYIKHNFTHHLKDKKKSNLGKYYTSGHLVQLVIDLVKPYLKEKSIVLDLAAGCGAFIGHFDGFMTIGRDIDKDAVKILCALGFKNVDHDNSLLNVKRSKYGLCDEDHVIVVGNPPYNDVTSKNKKHGAISKEKIDVSIDRDISSNDYGICFLKAFNKLKVDVICVLHPLSYLIKETNFNRLGVFTSNYHLKKAVIFSSREFLDTQKTPFPIIAALYLRGKGMSYEYIKNFQFDEYLNQYKYELIFLNLIRIE